MVVFLPWCQVNIISVLFAYTQAVRHHALQHGDRIMTIDNCDVTSPYS